MEYKKKSEKVKGIRKKEAFLPHGLCCYATFEQ